MSAGIPTTFQDVFHFNALLISVHEEGLPYTSRCGRAAIASSEMLIVCSKCSAQRGSLSFFVVSSVEWSDERMRVESVAFDPCSVRRPSWNVFMALLSAAFCRIWGKCFPTGCSSSTRVSLEQPFWFTGSLVTSLDMPSHRGGTCVTGKACRGHG